MPEDGEVDSAADRKEIGQNRTDTNRLEGERVRLAFPGFGRLLCSPCFSNSLRMASSDLGTASRKA